MTGVTPPPGQLRHHRDGLRSRSHRARTRQRDFAALHSERGTRIDAGRDSTFRSRAGRVPEPEAG